MSRTLLIFSLSYLALAGPTSLSFAAEFKLQDTQDHNLDILQDGQLVGRYMYALDLSNRDARHDTYKPYLHLFDPTGERPITKGAGGRFTHHRGIFRGWSKLNLDGKSYDTWHMKGNVQEHTKFINSKADSDGATFTSVILFHTD